MKRLTQIFQALLGVVALIFTAIIAFGRLAWRTVRNWWKNRSKWLRRSIIAIIILIPISIIAQAMYANYNNKYGRDYYDRGLSEDVSLRSFADNMWRVYSHKTKKYTTKKIDWLAMGDNDTLAVYAINDKRGFIDINSGNIIIDAETNNYSQAWIFSEGLAAVEQNGKIGFINAKNELVIPFNFDYSDDHDMSELAYLFHNGTCVMTSAKGKLGLIDKSGNWVVEPVFDQIWAPQEQGYRTVCRGAKFGILDSSLNLIYDTAYDYIGNHSETGGFILMNDGKMWQEDYEGNVVTPFMYESLNFLHYPISFDNDEYETEYQISDYASYQIHQKLGIINRLTGEVITLAIYEDIDMISEDVFCVTLADNYGNCLLDNKGNIINE